MIIALAGRRIDAELAPTPRFPLANIDNVRKKIHTILSQQSVEALVCSGACGADLLALEAAEQLKIARYILLPFARKQFRDLSVIDRPGNWEALFDRQCQELREDGKDHLKIFPTTHDLQRDFTRLNNKILHKALELQKATIHVAHSKSDILAVIIWDGKSRGDDDVTAAFAREAKQLKIPVKEVYTLQ